MEIKLKNPFELFHDGPSTRPREGMERCGQDYLTGNWIKTYRCGGFKTMHEFRVDRYCDLIYLPSNCGNFNISQSEVSNKVMETTSNGTSYFEVMKKNSEN